MPMTILGAGRWGGTFRNCVVAQWGARFSYSFYHIGPVAGKAVVLGRPGVSAGRLNGAALTGNVQLWASGPSPLTMNNCRQLPAHASYIKIGLPFLEKIKPRAKTRPG